MLRQASYAMGIGRVIDSVDVALYGLRRRLQSTLGIESFVDPRLLPASQHGMVALPHSDTNVFVGSQYCCSTQLLFMANLHHNVQLMAHNMLDLATRQFTTESLQHHCGMSSPTHPPLALVVPTCSPLLTSTDYKPQQQDATTVSRRAMLQTLVRCSAHQAVIGSLLSTDGAMGTASLQMQNAFGWRPLHMAVGNA